MTGSLPVTLAKWIEWIALALLPVVAAAKAVGAQTKPATYLEILHSWAVSVYLPLIAGFSLLALLGKAGQAYLGSESKIRVKAILDGLDQACFGSFPDIDRYAYRVTLFKANKKRTKLSPYCRAGARYQRGIPAFKIDDNNPNNNEGLGAKAWFRRATVKVNDLPECPDPWVDSDAKCQDYARRALLPAKKASRLHVKSRSILATPVRDIGHKEWGVLVLDGRDPNTFDAAREATVGMFTTALGKVL